MRIRGRRAAESVVGTETPPENSTPTLIIATRRAGRSGILDAAAVAANALASPLLHRANSGTGSKPVTPFDVSPRQLTLPNARKRPVRKTKSASKNAIRFVRTENYAHSWSKPSLQNRARLSITTYADLTCDPAF